MNPHPVTLGGNITATRGQRRAGIKQALLEGIELVGLDEAHIQRIAAAPLDESAHRAGLVGKGLRQLDAIEAGRRIEQGQRAFVTETLALDRRKTAGIQAKHFAVAIGHNPPVGIERIGRFIEIAHRTDARALAKPRYHHRKTEGAGTRQMQLIVLAGKGHAHAAKVGGQVIQA